MSSVVVELHHDVLNQNIRVSEILRKAFVIAKKLGLKEFEDWTIKELNGYKSGDDIPDYRVMRCELKSWDSYNGWQPIQIRNVKDFHEKFSRRDCGQSVAELESLIEDTDKTSPIEMPISPTLYQLLAKALDYPTRIASLFPPTAPIGILNSVRTIILKWTRKLEEDGILGEGLSFTSTEKQAAAEHPYNVHNYYGPVHSRHDQSTHLHAAVSRSNIAIHSADVNQSIEPPDEYGDIHHHTLFFC